MHYEDDVLNIIAPLGFHHTGFLRGSFLGVVFLALTTHFVSRCSRFTTGLIFPPVLSLELYELTFAQVFFSNSCFVFANAH